MTSEIPPHQELLDAIENVLTPDVLEGLGSCNRSIFIIPEHGWNETTAHNILSHYLEKCPFTAKVKRSAYGISTALEARSRSEAPGGRTVNFNAEYNALPKLGHACGRNLVATASLTAFVVLSYLVKVFQVRGTVQLLGTPAHDTGGGKITLLKMGAYKDIDVSLMGRPIPVPLEGSVENISGYGGQSTMANSAIVATFYGQNAHAVSNPWDGINALDAVICAYNNISVLRQQIHPEEKVFGRILEAPPISIRIPDFAKVEYSFRCINRDRCIKLKDRVLNCLKAAATATGCDSKYMELPMYMDMQLNRPLCNQYASWMSAYEEKVQPVLDELSPAPTDQGNISYAIPSLCAMFGIPAGNASPYEAGFKEYAGTKDAFRCAITAGKALALTGWEVLTNDDFFEACRNDWMAKVPHTDQEAPKATEIRTSQKRPLEDLYSVEERAAKRMKLR